MKRCSLARPDAMRPSVPLTALFAAPLLVACAVPHLDTSEEAAAAVRAQDLGTLPYHPVALRVGSRQTTSTSVPSVSTGP